MERVGERVNVRMFVFEVLICCVWDMVRVLVLWGER